MEGNRTCASDSGSRRSSSARDRQVSRSGITWQGRAAVPDPRWQRAGRRFLAEALGFAEALHAGAISTGWTACRSRRPSGSSSPRTRWATISNRTSSAFKLPVETGVRVRGLSREGERYRIDAGDREYEADHVVVAMASYQEPKVPGFARDLRPDIVQMHSSEYRNPAQLRDGPVLLVGAGNSGAEIARETVKTHPTLLSGREPARSHSASTARGAAHRPAARRVPGDVPPDPLARARRSAGRRTAMRVEGHAADPGQVEGPQAGRRRAACRGWRE